MINGVINIYKEAGFTSHDVVAKLRGITKQKKIGHTGTLDPAAEGVLPVCLGNATKLCDLITDWDKTYEAVLLLGISTDTQDTTGTVLAERPVTTDEAEVCSAAASFVGDYAQVPPMYSALKVGGKKLYELAREGKEVERKARLVQISRLEILEIKLPRVRMRVTCSKGTYIRTLCHDIGEKLGCGGCMEKLIRTRVGRFRMEEALRLSELQAWIGDEEASQDAEVRQAYLKSCLGSRLTQVDELFPASGRLYLKPEGDRLVRNGNPFSRKQVREEIPGEQPGRQEFRVYDSGNCFLGIYRLEERERLYRPVKMFLEKES